MADDQQIDQLLKAALRRRDAQASSAIVDAACLDAETLAAWSAGAIPSAAAGEVELHLSNCARCQEMAAVFAETEPTLTGHREARERAQLYLGARGPTPAPRALGARAPRGVVRWVLPLAAAAAAGLVWFVWTPAKPLPPKSETMARSQPSEISAVAPPTPLGGVVEGRQAPAELKRTAPESGRASAAPTSGRANAARDAQPTAPARSKLSDLDALATRDAAVPRAQPTVQGAAPPPVMAAPVPPPPAATPPPVTPPPPAMPPPPVPTAQPQTQVAAARPDAFRAMAESVTADARAVVAEFSSADPTAAPGAAGRGAAVGAGGGRATGALMQARAVAPLPRWRILASGAVERSTDTGGSWAAVAIDPPVHVIGGVSPSPVVCWLIGRRGVVLLSTDGVRFERVSFPETTELSSIRATSARQATVTTADGRVFVTTDGGVTWRGTTGRQAATQTTG